MTVEFLSDVEEIGRDEQYNTLSVRQVRVIATGKVGWMATIRGCSGSVSSNSDVVNSRPDAISVGLELLKEKTKDAEDFLRKQDQKRRTRS